MLYPIEMKSFIAILKRIFYSYSRYPFYKYGIGSVSHVRDRTRKSLCAIPYYVFQTQCDQRKLGKNAATLYTKHVTFLCLHVVRINHFWVHNLQKSRDLLTDPRQQLVS